MFRILSKESNIFSIPVYILFLFFIVVAFNIFSFNTLQTISAIITFIGIALGYFCFHAIALNYQSHLPLFLYTFFVFGLYPGDLDIGISVTLLTDSFLILILTSNQDDISKKSYVLVGAILALNYFFLPTTWPMIFFVIMHIIGTSQNIILNIFKLFFGGFLVVFAYFCFAYFLDLRSWDSRYFPFSGFTKVTDFSMLYPLIPIALLSIYAIFDHFSHYNQKSPISKFKYTFLLLYTLAQLTTIVLYMGYNYQYLILLALPLTIILSRMLRFLPKYWMRELGLWLIIICLVVYKLSFYY